MYLEFLSPFGAWKAGDVPSDTIPDGVARSLIDSGQAKEIDIGSYLAKSVQSEMAKAEARFDEKLRGLQQKPPPKGPPAGGGGVNFNHISEGKPPEDRTKGSFTEALRAIAMTCGIGVPPELQEWGRRCLRNKYSDEVVEYKLNEETGKLDQTITRTMADGGMETITRTGTDSISGGVSYGFTLKPDFIGTLFEIAMEQSVFASATTPVPWTQGNEIKWPALDQYKAPTTVGGIPQAAVFGGIQFAYKGEVTQRTASDAATNMITFKIEDLTAFTSFSRDYIVDNYIAMDKVVTTLFGRGMGWIKDYVTIRGDGVGKPQGYFNANARIEGGGVAGGATRAVSGKITSDDLMYMLSRMATMCWPDIRWIANVTTIPQLGILRDATGAAVFQPNALVGQWQQLSIMADSAVDRAALLSKPMGSLVGKPIYFTEKVPVLGTKGDLSLVCPSQYGLCQRPGIEIGISDQFYFDTDRIAYRVKDRHDGRSLWRAPYQQADGSNTNVTPFFILN